jgi:hypothetical protein
LAEITARLSLSVSKYRITGRKIDLRPVIVVLLDEIPVQTGGMV